jgi:hypothetical protein
MHYLNSLYKDVLRNIVLYLSSCCYPCKRTGLIESFNQTLFSGVYVLG